MKPTEARTGKTDWDMVGIAEADLEQFSQGNTRVFETLFREYQGEVYGWIIRILHDSGAAEDLSVLVILMLAGFVVLRFGYNVLIPMERFLVFPLAIVPGLWGLWNMLHMCVKRRRIRIER
jgi:hypothetical protein